MEDCIITKYSLIQLFSLCFSGLSLCKVGSIMRSATRCALNHNSFHKFHAGHRKTCSMIQDGNQIMVARG
ncbi:unnamed protein product [Sphenostylis stenocarpa]|uniref:Uncharacterized protein n=1 Tax=Sphenostylis stenocarpa TaxID=92480 RepID=A0AA86SL73_9FABA|nr:unnamed protein product [Sphenostylis stenocarpa]